MGRTVAPACADCRHYEGYRLHRFSRCARTSVTTRNLVTGDVRVERDTCVRQRALPSFWPFRGCGARGRHFEPKDSSP